MIVALHDSDRKSVVKACPKLTDRHVAPNAFQKMNVKLATQVLSHTCSSAVRTGVSINTFSDSIKSKALPTAIFLEKMDSLFDCLNSKMRFDNRKKYRSAMTSEGDVAEFLKDIRGYVCNIKSPAKISCLKGIIQTVNAILCLTEDLFKSDLNITYFLTHKVNQDPLENFFSQIRGRGGFNRHTSVAEFNNIIGRIMSMKLLSYSSNITNCENDEEEFIRTIWRSLSRKLQQIWMLANELHQTQSMSMTLTRTRKPPKKSTARKLLCK